MAKGTLVGNVFEKISNNHIKVGDKLSFIAETTNLEDFDLNTIENKYKVISTIPSIDTSVCLLQTTQFNKTILEKYPDIQLITISRDLPFALNRGCESFLHPQHLLLSDANYRDFGNKTKLYFDFINLLIRSVLVLDHENKVIYLQIVSPVTSEPNYQEVYDFLATIK
ncbi:thiol peroxidase [Spiroplasma chrysopicola]|uniref:Thiol peroxidase n=1 Tax=Spiroplasma chrysopicola DF-1 TaxID=1276227 RepID=R4UAX8_9MOLU|nr:redoxin family protein [Spiroplasma chrysopicola]AGM25059.1 thiol peroxidase [Spiroplasma chrysopicola DF-1]